MPCVVAGVSFGVIAGLPSSLSRMRRPERPHLFLQAKQGPQAHRTSGGGLRALHDDGIRRCSLGRQLRTHEQTPDSLILCGQLRPYRSPAHAFSRSTGRR